MPERGYQKNFYILYDNLSNDTVALSKARKILEMLQCYGGRDLEQCACLDLGCSSGIITSYAAQFFSRTVGLDYDAIGLSRISEDRKKTNLFIRGDAMTLPFENESFDAVICAQVYEHVPDDLRLFSEINRVLRPGGIAFFSGPNKLFPIEPHYFLPFLHWLPGRLADTYLHVFGRAGHFYERSRTIWDLRKQLAGFDIFDVTVPVLRRFASEKTGLKGKIFNLLSNLPGFAWSILIPLIPNFNWVLRKSSARKGKNVYQILH